MASTAASRRFITRLALMMTAAVLVASVNAVSYAAPIDYGYSGVITSADPSTGAIPGAPFSGTITYDPAKLTGGLAIEGSSQATFGRSVNDAGSVADGSNLTLQVGGQSILVNPGGVQISVAEIQYPGQYGYRDAGGNPANPYTTVVISNQNIDGGPIQAFLTLTNSTQSVFTSLATPDALSLANFPQAQLSVTEMTNSGSKTLYTGTIDSLVELPVPEPPLASIFGFIAIAWFARSRRL
jgi:hypothetical protein